MKLTRITLAMMALLMAAVSVAAQQRGQLSPEEESQYIISVRAGRINLVEGEVLYKNVRADWDILTAGDALSNGSSVKTGMDGRVEILLNPGSYLRLSENSEFTFTNTSLYSLDLNLLKGSAIIEAAAIEDSIIVKTPDAEYSIEERGLYRFNIGPDEKSEVLVRKGKVMVADTKVKKGKRAVIAGGAPLVSKFDKKIETDFDLWSEGRAKTLLAANRRLSKDRLKTLLNGFTVSSFWLYDRGLGYYTFLPGWGGFSSPYGGGYSRCNPYGYWYPWSPGYNPYYSGGRRNAGSGNNGGGTTAGSGGTNRGGANRGGGGTVGRPSAPNPGGGGRGRGAGDMPRMPERGIGGTGGMPRMPSMPAEPSSGGGRVRRNNN